MSVGYKLMNIRIVLIFIFGSCSIVYCYSTHSALSSVVFTNIDDPPNDVHSEYYFGTCATRYRTLQLHRHFTYNELKGNLIVGEWVNITEEPSCIYIRAKSRYGDIVRYQASKFAICMCSIIYNYGGEMFVYHYYEWYIPLEIRDGVEWDIFFYVPTYIQQPSISYNNSFGE